MLPQHSVAPFVLDRYTQSYLRLLVSRIRREFSRVQTIHHGASQPSFLGLGLSGNEAQDLLNSLEGELKEKQEAQDQEDQLASQAVSIYQRDTRLPSRRLADLFALPPAAVDILMAALAAEIDSRFSQLYACLNNDPARRWLTPGLCWHLLGLDGASPAARSLFDANAPLIHHEMFHLTATEHGVPLPLIDRPVVLDERISAFLLGHDILDPVLTGILSLKTQPGAAIPAGFEPEMAAMLAHLAGVWQSAASQNGPRAAALLWGPAGCGTEPAAGYLAALLKQPLLNLDGRRLAEASDPAWLWQRARRESALRGAVLLLSHFERLPAAVQERLWEDSGRGIIFACEGERPSLPPNPPLMLAFPIPAHESRKRWWRLSLNGSGGEGADELADELAGRFRLTPGQIEQAAAAARHAAQLRGSETPQRSDWFEGARMKSNPALSRLAERVIQPYTWDDLVLPPSVMGTLRSILAQARYAHQVYEEWGFGTRLPYGRGLAALFSGPAGTGKTMSAGILARELELDLYKIDLSGVVSKYIGETEKNLERIFSEAASANVILFFDEADALFGKRSEVKDAHDRYANIEISYLLQRMESYEGISILATNLGHHLDEAFTRRMQYVVEFPLPDAEERERIWRGLFPAGAPVEQSIDFNFLARRFELTGGHIKNCVLAAAFLAAETGGAIRMEHLVQAVARELGKMGQAIQRSDFESYYSTVRQTAK